MKVLDFIKSLFCTHEYEFVSLDMSCRRGRRAISVCKCRKCGKLKVKNSVSITL